MSDIIILVTELSRAGIAAGLTCTPDTGLGTVTEKPIVTVAVIVTGLAIYKEKDGTESTPVVICILPADENEFGILLDFRQKTWPVLRYYFFYFDIIEIINIPSKNYALQI